MKRSLTILACLLAFNAGAATIYVSASGSGSGCTVGTPCTIQTALGLVNAGDTILAVAGTYSAGTVPDATRSGADGNPITIRSADPNDKAYFSQDFRISAPWYVVEQVSFRQLRLNAEAPFTVLRSNLFQNGNTLLDLRSSSNSVYANTFTNIGLNNGIVGLTMSSGSSANVIATNLFTGSNGRDQIRPFGSDHIITGNAFSNIISGATAGNGAHTDLIQVFASSDSTVSTNIIFERNFIYNSAAQLGNSEKGGTGVLYANAQMGGWKVRNNLFINSRFQWNNYLPDCVFENNTIYGSTATSGVLFNSSSTKGTAANGRVRNNLFIRTAATYSKLSDTVADYNMHTLADDSASGNFTEPNGINGGYTPAQIWVDPDNGNFALIDGSPAVGSGINLYADFTDDYNGTARASSGAWDRGAISYNETPAPAAPASLTATANNFNSVSLSWANVADETGYKLERSTTIGSGFAEIATRGADVLAYTDETVASGTEYFYRVRAYNAAGNSAYTSEASVITPLAPPAGPLPQQTSVRASGGSVAAGNPF